MGMPANPPAPTVANPPATDQIDSSAPSSIPAPYRPATPQMKQIDKDKKLEFQIFQSQRSMVDFFLQMIDQGNEREILQHGKIIVGKIRECTMHYKLT